MKAVFFTEGGKYFGLGHLTRCIALAQAFAENDIPGEFILNADTSAAGLMVDLKTDYLDWTGEAVNLNQYINTGDIAVIDSYHAGVEKYRQIQERAKSAIYFDDFNRFPYPPGIVINGALPADKIPYPATAKITYLLGPEYQALRKPFWKSNEVTLRSTVQNIFLSCGGSDPHRLTAGLVEFFEKHFPELRIITIVGSSFQDRMLNQQVAESNADVLYAPAVDVLIEAMKKSDLALIAAGQTIYELAALGIPPIVIGMAENQKHNITGWLQTGYIEFAGWWDEKSLLENIKRDLDKLIADPGLRLSKQNTGRQIIDGQGCRRIIQKVLEYV